MAGDAAAERSDSLTRLSGSMDVQHMITPSRGN